MTVTNQNRSSASELCGRNAELLSFIVEREAIRGRKAAGEPWPWTEEPILQTYRFLQHRSRARSDDRLVAPQLAQAAR
jgi:hypothetical protein